MSRSRPATTSRLAGGTLKVVAAELLIIPSGLLTSVYLARHLGPSAYGLFTLALTLVAWIQWTLSSLLARTTVKFVSETDDWAPIGTTILKLHLLLGCAAAAGLALLAGPLARLLDAPEIATYLRLFAIDIPLFTLAHGHRDILTGRGSFGARAMASAGRWSARLVLIVGLVHLGLGIPGAILGSILATSVELAIARWFARPPILLRGGFPIRRLWTYAGPLFLFVAATRLLDKMDLVMLKGLGGTAADVGFFGAAQNLALLPIVLAGAFSPLLLASVSQELHMGTREKAQALCGRSSRGMLYMIPVAAAIAGAAPEIIQFLFGTAFLPGAPLLALLTFAGAARALLSADTAMLTAAGKPRWTFAIAGPMVLLALVGHLLIIPRWGAVGAAAVTMVVSVVGALASAAAVRRVWGLTPPWATLARCLAAGAVAYVIMAGWATPGALLWIKIGIVGLVIPGTLAILGEFDPQDRALLRSLLPS